MWPSFSVLFVGMVLTTMSCQALELFHYKSVAFHCDKDQREIFIGKSSVMIYFDSRKKSSLFSCTLRIQTEKDLGLALFLKMMDLPSSNGAHYVKFSTQIPGYHGPTKVFSDPIYGQIESSNASAVYLNRSQVQNWQMFNETGSNWIDIELYRGSIAKFQLFVAPIWPKCDLNETNLFRCCQESHCHCISRSLTCDGIINCMTFSSIALDESPDQCGHMSPQIVVGGETCTPHMIN